MSNSYTKTSQCIKNISCVKIVNDDKINMEKKDKKKVKEVCEKENYNEVKTKIGESLSKSNSNSYSEKNISSSEMVSICFSKIVDPKKKMSINVTMNNNIITEKNKLNINIMEKEKEKDKRCKIKFYN